MEEELLTRAAVTRQHGEHGVHARFHVIVHVAVKHPHAGPVGRHVQRSATRREDLRGVEPAAILQKRGAMPVGVWMSISVPMLIKYQRTCSPPPS